MTFHYDALCSNQPDQTLIGLVLSDPLLTSTRFVAFSSSDFALIARNGERFEMTPCDPQPQFSDSLLIYPLLPDGTELQSYSVSVEHHA